MKKIFITFEKAHQLLKKIAKQMIKEKWTPDCIVAIASGGLIPARIIKTFIKKDIYVVGLTRYEKDKPKRILPTKIQWIDEVEKKLKGKKILLVDEIDDTRITLSYCLKELLKHKPKEIRVAVIHVKNKEKKGEFPPEVKKAYYGKIVPDVWIKYPWEADDIKKHNKGKD